MPNCEKIRTTEKVTPTTVMRNRVRSWNRFLRAMSTIGHPWVSRVRSVYSSPRKNWRGNDLAAQLLDQVGNLLGLRELGVDLGGPPEAGHGVALLAQLRVGQPEVVLDLTIGRRLLVRAGQGLLSLRVGAALILDPAQGVGHLGRSRRELRGLGGERQGLVGLLLSLDQEPREIVQGDHVVLVLGERLAVLLDGA